MNSLPGTDGPVIAAMMHDPDGPGPAPARLIAGGSFAAVGTTPMSCIAAWDPIAGSWSSLGSGVSGYVVSVGAVRALATLANGDLVAGGGLATAGTLAVNCIARWDGTAWSPLGAGVGDPNLLDGVDAMTTLLNGDLIAGGTFATAGGATVNNIARWNGTAWSALGSGVNNRVFALITMPNGDVVATGAFSTAGGAAANRVARWNGTAWSPLGGGLPGYGYALCVLPNGNLLAATFAPGPPGSNAPGSTLIWQWNGSFWSQLGAAISGAPSELVTLPNGSVIATGGTLPYAGYCVSWNGAAWLPLGAAPDSAVSAATVLPNGDLVAGGYFSSVGSVAATGIARWNGTAWSPLIAATPVSARALTTMPSGDVIAGGYGSLSRWNGAGWSPLSSVTSTTPPAEVHALTSLPNGDLVAGGSFTAVGGVPAARIARWNGTAWFPLGAGTNGDVFALVVLPNGDLVAGGWSTTAANHVARWNGTAWAPLGSGFSLAGVGSGWPTAVNAFAILPNGDLVAGGLFTSAGGVVVNHIARWNGTAWFPLGAGMDDRVAALAVLPNGDLVAGGWFTTAGGVVASQIARWDGAAWSSMGTGLSSGVTALAALPNGDVIAGGDFASAGGIAASRIARWDGTAWAPLGAGANAIVQSMTRLPNGDWVIGGAFTFVNNLVSPSVARLTTTCPATANSAGSGCAGSGGLNELTATSLPWIGSTQTSRATGMPAQSLAVGVFGFSAVSTPLSSILPQGAAGCDLLVSPDLLATYTTGTGTVTTSLVIPNTPALVGQVIRHQVVPFEIDAAGAITAVTSTNAIVLTIGSF